jgi:hypothetical protein
VPLGVDCATIESQPLVLSLPSSQKQHVCVGNILYLARILKVLRGEGSGPTALITEVDKGCVLVNPTTAITLRRMFKRALELAPPFPCLQTAYFNEGTKQLSSG